MDHQPDATPQPQENGIVVLGGDKYMRDTSGRLVPLEAIKPEDLLMDDTARKVIAYAEDLSARIARFRGHTFDDIAATVDLMTEKYGRRLGGPKGNVTLTSFDGTLQVKVQVQDQITFGPELQKAKDLADACIARWAEGANPQVRALIQHAFQVDKEGRINRSALFQLRRMHVEGGDADWTAAMEALSSAIRVIGSKEYVRFYRRDTPRGRWEPISIDLASA
jgi:hypothetical protein